MRCRNLTPPGERRPSRVTINPLNAIIIIDGVFVLTYESANRYYNDSYFVDASLEVIRDRGAQRYIEDCKYSWLTLEEVKAKESRKQKTENLPLVQHQKFKAKRVIINNEPAPDYVRDFQKIISAGEAWTKEHEEKDISPTSEEKEKWLREEFLRADGIRGSPEKTKEKTLARLYQNLIFSPGTHLFKAVSQLIVRQGQEDWFNSPTKQESIKNLIEEFKLADKEAVLLRNAIDIKKKSAASALITDWNKANSHILTDRLREEGSSAIEMNRRLYLTVAGREAVSSPSSRGVLFYPRGGIGYDFYEYPGSPVLDNSGNNIKEAMVSSPLNRLGVWREAADLFIILKANIEHFWKKNFYPIAALTTLGGAITAPYCLIAGILISLLAVSMWILYAEANKRQSRIDHLTGLYNRKSFDNQLSMEILRAGRSGSGKGLSLIMFDLDHFKGINDKYGHLAGDAVLKNIAQIVKKQVRVIDFIARYGGEEFVVILPETTLEGAKIIAEKIRRVVAENKIIDLGSAISIQVTISLGVASVTKETDSTEDLIKRADIRLYAAKGLGRNRVVWWDSLSFCVNPRDTDESGKPKVSSPLQGNGGSFDDKFNSNINTANTLKKVKASLDELRVKTSRLEARQRLAFEITVIKDLNGKYSELMAVLKTALLEKVDILAQIALLRVRNDAYDLNQDIERQKIIIDDLLKRRIRQDKEDYYQILGVSRSARHDEIKRAYRTLALKYHPDRNPGNRQAEKKFRLAAEAWGILGDSDKRKQYDSRGCASPLKKDANDAIQVVTKEVIVADINDIHMRPSVRIAEAAIKFPDTEIITSKGNKKPTPGLY